MSKYKNSAKDKNFNADFCDFLSELAEYEKNIRQNIYSYNSYRKAASVLATYPKRIQSGENARKLCGIGFKISKKIDEFLENEKVMKFKNIHLNKGAEAMLTRVSGIGPGTASDFVKNGIKTIGDLKLNVDKLNHHQKIGLKYFSDFEEKISRNEIKEIKEKLRSLIYELDAQFILTVCGGYRRGNHQNRDIDVLVTHPSCMLSGDEKKHNDNLLKKIVDSLTGLVTDVISIEDTKFMGVCRLHSELPARRIDIRLIPWEQYYCALLHFTGSEVFNKKIRAYALEKGFTLNEYALRPIGVNGVPGDAMPISCEEDIFDYIDFPYKPPKERNM